MLRERLGDVRIEDLRAPRLSIPVTNLSGCASEILSKGPLAEAILASCAVPVLFNAVRIDRNYYWDGGLANSLPVEHLCDDPGIHTVILHHVTHGSEHGARGLRGAPSIAQAFNVTHQVVNDQIYRLSCDKLEAAGKRVIYCETRTRRPSLLRRHRRGFAEAGARTAAAHRRLWMGVDAADASARGCPT
jgi:predicted acylesterase/phospholipase RssA